MSRPFLRKRFPRFPVKTLLVAQILTHASGLEVALVAALYAGNWRTAKRLLNEGVCADIEWRTESCKLYGYSDTPLTWVMSRGIRPISSGDRQIKELYVVLLNAGADPNRGWPSALYYSIKTRSDLDVAKMLVNQGAQADEEERQRIAIDKMRKSGLLYGYRGESALAFASGLSLKHVQFLVEKGAPVNGVCGGDALINACESGKYEIVVYLINKGANVNYESISGHTPLRVALGELWDNTYKEDIISILRMHKAVNMGSPVMPDNRSSEGTPIEVAVDVPKGQIPPSWEIITERACLTGSK
jgi:hypothetical protein